MTDNTRLATLTDLRTEIDAVDDQLLSLLNRRAGLARQVGELKQQTGDAQFWRPEREAAVLQRLMAANQGPLTDETIGRLFREVMSSCLALEKPVTVAYLGPEGTFTQLAARKHFGQAANLQPASSIG